MKYQICIKRRKMNLRNVRYNAEMADYFKSLNSFMFKILFLEDEVFFNLH